MTSKFDIDCYLGEWVELVRLPNPFEKGLCNVRATYSRWSPDSGDIKVVNQGTDIKTGRVRTVVGKAVPIESEGQGVLSVSFSPQGSGKYIVLATDYCTYSVVGSESRDMLWFLVRDTSHKDIFPHIPRMVQVALDNGYSESDFKRMC